MTCLGIGAAIFCALMVWALACELAAGGSAASEAWQVGNGLERPHRLDAGLEG
jgi:hypothetical protein